MILVAGFVTMGAYAGKVGDEILGSWKYKISDVPPEYETGILQFEKQEDKIVGFIGNSPDRKMPVKNLTTVEDKVSFKLDFDGGEISVNLKREGDKMTGKLTTSDGEFAIQAEKVERK